MTISEIFQKANIQALSGVMFHTRMAELYWFLSFPAYAREQEEHAKTEQKGFLRLQRYYIRHYNGVLPAMPEGAFDVVQVLLTPDIRRNDRDGLDERFKRQMLRAAALEWLNWETEAAKVYNEAAANLDMIYEMAASNFLTGYAEAAEKEQAFARERYIELDDADFDLKFVRLKQ